MLLKLTLSGLQSPALLHSFTIPENSEPSLLFQGFADQMTFNLRPIAALRLFEPALDGGPATKKRTVRKPADVAALSPSIRIERSCGNPQLFRIPLQQPHFDPCTF
jgi:hypothetical protein